MIFLGEREKSSRSNIKSEIKAVAKRILRGRKKRREGV